MLDFDEIRKEVAIRHNVLLGKDDPILVTVTVNELVLSRYIELVTERYDEANRAISVSLEQQIAQSKETAGKIITDAADYVSKEIQRAVADAMKEAVAELRLQLVKIQTENHEVLNREKEAKFAKNIAFFSAIVAGIATVISIAVLIMAVVK